MNKVFLMNCRKYVSILCLSALITSACTVTGLAGVRSYGVAPKAGTATGGPSVPGSDPEAALPAAGSEGHGSALQISYYDTAEADGIMTLEAANHWARFDFEANPSIDEDWSCTMDHDILSVESSFLPKDASDTSNINDGSRRFVLTPTALGTVTVRFDLGKAGEEPIDTMIYTFRVDEDLRITLTNAENPHGDKSIIVRPVVK